MTEYWLDKNVSLGYTSSVLQLNFGLLQLFGYNFLISPTFVDFIF